ncbi:MAG: alpha-ketoglutarate-dependent taurine dioxygenase [Lentisphaeria bacterium]|jgi:alpha-ketoglutarate-dependent taurine dioxygenase
MTFRIDEIHQKGTTLFSVKKDPGVELNEDSLLQLAQYIDRNDVVLLRNFDLQALDDFKAFSDSFNDQFQPYVGGAFEREPVQGDRTILEVTGGKTSLVPLHGEMYYSQIKPSRLWFYCHVAPSKGGATQVCDAATFYRQLSETTKTLLQNNLVSYIVTYQKEEWRNIFQNDDLQKVKDHCESEKMDFKVLPNDGIQTTYTTSPLVKHKDGSMLFINNLIPILAQEYILQKNNRVVRLQNGTQISLQIFEEFIGLTNAIAYDHNWQSQDVIVVNNQHVMHGRTQIIDQNRHILVRLGYEASLRCALR